MIAIKDLVSFSTSTLWAHKSGFTVPSVIFKSTHRTRFPSSSIITSRCTPSILFIGIAIILTGVHEMTIAAFYSNKMYFCYSLCFFFRLDHSKSSKMNITYLDNSNGKLPTFQRLQLHWNLPQCSTNFCHNSFQYRNDILPTHR